MNNSFDAYGRLCSVVPTMEASAYADDFGESGIKTFLYGSTFYEGGGNNNYLWRGKVLWQCLTAKEF